MTHRLAHAIRWCKRLDQRREIERRLLNLVKALSMSGKHALAVEKKIHQGVRRYSYIPSHGTAIKTTPASPLKAHRKALKSNPGSKLQACRVETPEGKE